MEEKLFKIFEKTKKAHFDSKLQISLADYLYQFRELLHQEVKEAPVINYSDKNLSTYLELSVMVLTMVKLFEGFDYEEEHIGKIIYETALTYFKVPSISRILKSKLFFSKLNYKAIKKRELKTQESAHGLNGFKLRLVRSANKDNFSVIYEECGICKYYKSKGMEKYIKYCCLVDYCIMENIGVSFSRKGTMGNGADFCDFNFKKKGKISKGWPPYELEEFVLTDK